MTLSTEEEELVQAAVANARVILEYSAGETTMLVASQPGKYLITVEGHRYRAIQIQMEIDVAGFPSSTVIWHVDPSTDAGGVIGYANSVWSESFFRHPDLILLRGPTKSACLVAMMLRIARPVTILFEGWSSNAQRVLLERLIMPARIVGHIAELRLVPTASTAAMQSLLFELCHSAEKANQTAKALYGEDESAADILGTEQDQGESPLIGMNSRKSLDLPPWTNVLNRPKAPKAVLVIASQPRCGSHMLGQVLAKDGRFGMPLEYLHPRHWASWGERCGTKVPDQILEEMIRFRTSSYGVFAVKAHWSQFKRICDLGLDDFFRGARYVFLTRRDLLGQSISFDIARQTGAWAAEQQVQKIPRFRSRRIRETMTEVLFQRSSWERFRALTGVAGIDLTYEDILEDPRTALTRISRLVCLPEETSGIFDQTVIPTKIQRGSINNEWRLKFLRTIERASRMKSTSAK